MSTVRQCLAAILRRTEDGIEDGKGLNRIDKNLGWDVIGLPQWSKNQEEIVRKILNKYKKQILDLGFDLEKLETEAFDDDLVIQCKWKARTVKAHLFILPSGKEKWIGNGAFQMIDEDKDGNCLIKIPAWLSEKEKLYAERK